VVRATGRRSPLSRDQMSVSEAMTQVSERAIVALAYIVVKHGARYAPPLARLEAEHAKLHGDPVQHAQAILDRYSSTGNPP
jgi:hypothetical protein